VNKESHSSSKKSIFRSPKTIIAFVLLLISPILTVVLIQQRQDLRQRAQVLNVMPAPVAIDIVDFKYTPGTVTVTAGTIVTWTNRSTAGVPHTTTADVLGTPNSWDSQFLNPGQSFSKTFNTPGTYKYHCNVHGAAVMSGTIIVLSSTPQPTSTLFPTRAITTPAPTTSVTSGLPSPTAGGPEYVCLGACPTPTPTVTPTPPYMSPTPTPKPYISITPTPTKVYASPSPTITPKPYTSPSPTPTLVPCPTNYSTIASDNGTSLAGYGGGKSKHKNKGGSIFSTIFDFFMKLIFKLLEILFGFHGTPGPVVGPSPVIYPTAIVHPTNPNYPTSPINKISPTFPPAPTVYDTPAFKVYDPSKTPAPTNPYAPTVTLNPYVPTMTPNPYATVTPTPPCVPPTSTPYVAPTSYAPTPTQPPYAPTVTPTTGYHGPTMTPPFPTPSLTTYISPTALPTTSDAAPTSTGMISVADIKYVPGNEPLKTFDLTASVVGDRWEFNGQFPGPEIRATQGDHVRVNVHNNIPEPLTVHWHGIKLPSSQDGVPGMTQDAIPPGNSLTYDFVVPDKGTYWYHSHQNPQVQDAKGLTGLLVVDPKTSSSHYDREYYIDYVNTDPVTKHYDATPGETVHVRILNSRVGDFAGTPLRLVPIGVPYKIVALDGQDINQPQEIASDSALLNIGYAQRYDLSFTMPASGGAMIADAENLQTIQFGPGVDSMPDGLGSLPIFDSTMMASYGVPGTDTNVTRITPDRTASLVIGPDLSINGKLGMEIPELIMHKDEVLQIHFVNNSNMTHPMHLHGHFYSLIKKNDQPLTGSPIHLDTYLIRPGETADMLVYADDPGIWMLHCHIADHAALGLSMNTRYDNVFNPYKIPGEAGNHPM
jgi:FtsP/CotA-like multicopper oxidase with cupredoxin domain